MEGNTGSEPTRSVRLLTVPQVAEILNVSEPKVWQLVGRGKIRSLKIDTSRRVTPQAVDEYIASLVADEQARQAGSAA